MTEDGTVPRISVAGRAKRLLQGIVTPIERLFRFRTSLRFLQTADPHTVLTGIESRTFLGLYMAYPFGPLRAAEEVNHKQDTQPFFHSYWTLNILDTEFLR